VAALSYATYIVLLKGGADRDDSPAPLKLLIVCVTGTIALGVAAPALGESLVIPNLKTLLAIIGMAAVVQIGGWLLILRGMKTTSATSAGLVLVAQPVLAMVWDSLFFARPFGLRELLGGTLTLIAIIWGTWLANRATPTS
jgi:drug/metabolite transporter (DMT)-like permease